MNPNPLKITVITVCLNAEKHVEETVRSVLSQTYPNLEYIIVDGGSTDGTMAIAGRYRDRIAKIVSEKDSGIYDAMNKGIRCATGDVIYFLNAGDYFLNENSVASMVSAFGSHPEADLVIARAKGVNAPAAQPEPIPSVDGRFLSQTEIIIHGICHQRVFARRELFNKIGVFDQNYTVCADQDWMYRAIYKKARIVFIDHVVATYDLAGFSRKNKWIMYLEGFRARLHNMPLHEFFLFLGPVFYVALRRRIVNWFKNHFKS